MFLLEEKAGIAGGMYVCRKFGKYDTHRFFVSYALIKLNYRFSLQESVQEHVDSSG